MELIHMTAAYSNAVLVAVLPYVSDFASKLHLPIPQPVTTNQVGKFVASPFKDSIGGGLWLTNEYWFQIGFRGYMQGYRCPADWFFEQDPAPESLQKYVGKDNMTTNEAIELARKSLINVGFKPELVHMQDAPKVKGPFDIKVGHIPYCEILWEWPKGEDNAIYLNHVTVEINMESKTIAGMSIALSSTNKFDTVPPKVSMIPELEKDYRKRMTPNKMFINTNASKHLPSSD